jgi:hypothetical protein
MANNRLKQIEAIVQYLNKNIATGSMTTEKTGVPQKCFTRHKRALEKRGLLWVVRKGYCKVTNRRAQYVTTNRQLAIDLLLKQI